MVRRYSKSQYGFFSKLIELSKKYEIAEQKVIKTLPGEITLSPSDRITHSRVLDENNNTVEVTNVSYEIRFMDEWITIVRFDSTHGYLHRHMLVSLESGIWIVNRGGVIRKGSPNLWYSWAIKDIQRNFSAYRTGFTKRSNIPSLGY